MTGDDAGLAVADEHQGQHVDRGGIERGEGRRRDALARSSEIARKGDGGGGGPRRQQDLARRDELRVAALRARIIERDDEIALCGSAQPALDHRPGRQQVGERDGAEIMAERRADARSGGLQRREAGDHGERDAAPVGPVLAVDPLEDQAREAVDPGIARGDEGDAAA